jgi:hypothetical protein
MSKEKKSALDAVKAEADGSFDVKFRDVTFEILSIDDWWFDYAHFAERGATLRAIEAALGVTQYEQLRAARPTIAEATALMEQIAAGVGLTVGE